MEKKFLTIPEVAEKLRVGKSLIYRLAKEGELPVTHISGRVIISEESLLKYLEEKED